MHLTDKPYELTGEGRHQTNDDKGFPFVPLDGSPIPKYFATVVRIPEGFVIYHNWKLEDKLAPSFANNRNDVAKLKKNLEEAAAKHGQQAKRLAPVLGTSLPRKDVMN